MTSTPNTIEDGRCPSGRAADASHSSRQGVSTIGGNPNASPGPWCAERYVGREDNWFVRGSGNESVCGQGAGRVTATNARLIAAAPDFLAAAQRLIAVFDQQRMTNAERIIAGVSDAGLRTEGNAAIEALRSAIAKARGEAL